MKVDGKDIRTIWLDENENVVKIIDQRKLPHEFVIVDLKTVDDAITAIKDMYVRGGAPDRRYRCLCRLFSDFKCAGPSNR